MIVVFDMSKLVAAFLKEIARTISKVYAAHALGKGIIDTNKKYGGFHQIL